MLLVKPAIAKAQREAEVTQPGPDPGPELTPQPGPGPAPGPGPQPKPKVDYFFGSKTLDQTHYAMDFKKLMDEVLQHLAATPGVNLRMRVEIEADAPEGFTEFQVRTVSENSNALKFEQSEFEERDG